MRGTSEGTVKAQTNAIYRKAGVTGRPQLLSLFIDELMGEENVVKTRLAETSQPVPVTPAPAAEDRPTV